jgi:hypothetical protein
MIQVNLGVRAQAYNLSTWESEAGGSLLFSALALHFLNYNIYSLGLSFS